MVSVKRDYLVGAEKDLVNKLRDIEKQILSLKNKKALILRGHIHVISRRDLQSEDCGAICLICGENFGWWCPTAPYGYCEYSAGCYCDWCNKPEERD